MESIRVIEAAIKRNIAAGKRTCQRLEELHRERAELDSKLRRAKLQQVVGGEVVTRFRGDHPALDSQVGKLIEVRRTRCTVEFDGERWWFPIDRILPAADSELRGVVLGMGGQS